MTPLALFGSAFTTLLPDSSNDQLSQSPLARGIMLVAILRDTVSIDQETTTLDDPYVA
jgi:hypothetical protein